MVILRKFNYIKTVSNGPLVFFAIATYEVKVVPYNFVRRGVPVIEDTYPEPSVYEVG